jgi:hypothetical protein
LDGIRVKIAKVEIIDDTTRYTKDKNGNQILLPEGEELSVKKIKLTTEEFGQDRIGRNITHIEKYNLQLKNDKWIVSDTPLYYNHSQFYGDFSEKIEWKAVSTSNSQEHTFVVHNVIEGDDPNPLIFKTSTTEPLLGSSNIKKN